MARPDPAVPLRVPSEARRKRSEGGDDGRPRMRLVVARGQLGIELDEPFALDPIVAQELALSLPEVRFPVELSGGATAFRHKRGRLEHAVIVVSAAAAHRHARPRLEGLIPGALIHHLLAPLEDGWLIGMASDSAALAFELIVSPLDGDLRLVPVAARGVGLGAPAQALAARAAYALAKPLGRLAGGAVVIASPAVALSRELLPLAGIRAPEARGLSVSMLASDLEGTRLRLGRDEPPYASSERAIRAVELAALVAEAEDALLAGALDRARSGYLEALTRAPGHVEIALRLAALDASIGDRGEAALATVSDVMLPIEAGALGAQLLEAIGDREGARVAWRRAATQEAYGPLAALCWLQLAGASDDLHERRDPLDRAVARAPGMAAPRWQRFAHALSFNRFADARADLEHLEAQASDAGARHAVLRHAAEMMLAARALDEAAEVFERALRYTPDSVDAVAGLARALSMMGHRRRALELFARAAALAERSGRTVHRVIVDVARGLAEIADDRPAAIARVQSIDSASAAVFEARLLEARWRAEVGDLSGASVALARLTDAVEVSMATLVGAQPLERGAPAGLWGEASASGEGSAWGEGSAQFYASRGDACLAIATLLEEGARIQELDRSDVHAARHLLALGLRLAPRSASIGAAFRRVAAAADDAADGVQRPAASAQIEPEPDGVIEPMGEESVVPSVTMDAIDPDVLAQLEGGEDELAAEQLADRLRANPNDDAVALELSAVLSRLGRDHDLLALLSARVDETSGAARGDWTARRRAVLERLIGAARQAGRQDEAELYALMLQRS